MKTFKCIFGLLVLSSALTTWADEQACLTNERMILQGDMDIRTEPTVFDSLKGIIQLSPDGKKLLYIRPETMEVSGRQQRVSRLVLHDLTSDTETILPIPAYPEKFVPSNPIIGFSTNPFDKTGNKVVLGAGIDTNKNGLFDQNEKMHAVLFDSETSTITNLGVTGEIVVPSYNRAGDRYIVLALDGHRTPDEKRRLLFSDVNPIRWRKYSPTGVPKAISPSGDLLVLLKAGHPHDHFIPIDLDLHDLKEMKKTVSLPTFKMEGAISLLAYVFNPQWTTSGEYLYYEDIIGNPEESDSQCHHGAKVWDQKSQTLIKEMPNILPLGPGPTEASMVLLRVDEVDEGGGKVMGIVLHDASSDQTWEIPLRGIGIIDTNGRSIIYTRKNADGKQVVYMADISLPSIAGVTASN